MVIIEDIMPTHIHTRAFAYVRVCMYVRVFFSFCLFSGLLHFFLSFVFGVGVGGGGGGVGRQTILRRSQDQLKTIFCIK